ncbi:hypothetical protein [Bartonella sp. AP331QHHD]|uniref:hypothetical protein n=1 Tax=Bartonella sp. AP331QHHD TaxID=3243490 RepID=UPI0035D09776
MISSSERTLVVLWVICEVTVECVVSASCGLLVEPPLVNEAVRFVDAYTVSSLKRDCLSSSSSGMDDSLLLFEGVSLGRGAAAPETSAAACS